MLRMHDFFSHKVVIKLNRILHNGHIKNISKYPAQIIPIKNRANGYIHRYMKELPKNPRKSIGGGT